MTVINRRCRVLIPNEPAYRKTQPLLSSRKVTAEKQNSQHHHDLKRSLKRKARISDYFMRKGCCQNERPLQRSYGSTTWKLNVIRIIHARLSKLPYIVQPHRITFKLTSSVFSVSVPRDRSLPISTLPSVHAIDKDTLHCNNTERVLLQRSDCNP